jgi:hypothetical protein
MSRAAAIWRISICQAVATARPRFAVPATAPLVKVIC